MKTLLTPQQAADYLSVKLSTIRKWTHYGYIPKIKLGGAVRFDRDALDVWVEKRSSEGRVQMKVSAYATDARRSAQRPITLHTE
jgi:excisionase family DNA binding protein